MEGATAIGMVPKSADMVSENPSTSSESNTKSDFVSSEPNSKRFVEIQFQRLNKLFTYSPSMNLIFPNPRTEHDQEFRQNRENSKRNFDEFRRIFRRRSELKFEFVNQNLMENILILKRTCLGLMNDQKRTLSGQTISKNSSLTATYLEYLPHLCEELKRIFVSWIQIKVALLSNKWLQTKLNQNLDNYDIKSNLFFSLAVDVGQYLKSIIDTGIRLLGGLSADKISAKFCEDFILALNDYNSYVFMINFYSNRDFTDNKLETISIQDFLAEMSRSNGILLAETLSTKVARYCNTFSKLETNKSTNPISLVSIMNEEMDQKLKQVKFKDSHDTSDYYSSSASSSKTVPDNNVLVTNGSKNLVRIPFSSQTKLNKKLQHFYAHFFEQKFLIFNSFIQIAFGEKNAAKNCSDKNVEDKKRLEEIVQTERKELWKKCVSTTWEIFLKEMQKISKFGLNRIPSMMLTEENTTCIVVDFIVDLALVVPLPQELSSPKPLINNLQEMLLSLSWLSTTDSCQNHIHMDKNLQPFLISGKMKQMLDLGRFSNENIHLSSKQMFQNFTFCKSLWSLSSYNLQILIAIFCNYQSIFEHTETQFHVWLKTRLASKTNFVAMAALHETFPERKFWNRIRGEPQASNEYVPYLMSSVLEPIKLSQDIYDESCLPLKEIIIDQMFKSWLEFVKKKGIKFGPEAVKQLKFDFETAKLWVFENLCSSQSAKDKIQKLTVFIKLNTIFEVLSDTHQHDGPSAFFSNAKIVPSMITDKEKIEDDYNEKVLFKITPESVQWRRLRKSKKLNCLPCL